MGHTIKLENATVASIRPTTKSVSDDSFDFTSAGAPSATEGDDQRHDTWIPILSTGGGGVADKVTEGGLRSDGELVQALFDDGDAGGDFLF